MKADKGTASILGKTISPNNNAVLKHVGALIGAKPAYFPYLTGRQNVEYIADIFGMNNNRVDKILDFMGIAEAADRMPNLYSTGMKQRLGIAMAIVHKPKILILDEPTNGMDPTGMREIRELIKELAKQGITILLSSHLLHEVEQVCNRVAVFNRGKVVAEGSIKELQGNAQVVKIHTSKNKQTINFLNTVPELLIKSLETDSIEVTGLPSDQVIELLVKHNLTPTQVYTKGNSLEELFLQLIENEA